MDEAVPGVRSRHHRRPEAVAARDRLLVGPQGLQQPASDHAEADHPDPHLSHRTIAYSGNARPTESATHAGFSEPSTSTVKRVTTCHQPPPTSSSSVTSALARICEPAGTGAGKRTRFQP